nr:MAG TPA: hypothetical protein [Caudoviricetes sp.]
MSLYMYIYISYTFRQLHYLSAFDFSYTFRLFDYLLIYYSSITFSANVKYSTFQ